MKESVAVYIVISLFSCLQPSPSIDYLGETPPDSTAQLFAPGIISTDSFEHSAPAFSPDGSVVLWTVVDKSFRAYLLEMKYEDGKWSRPYRPSFTDSTADDYYPSFAPDGQKLYFSSRRKLPAGYSQNGGINIWIVERNQNKWRKAVPIDTALITGHEYAHSVTADGSIYFSSSNGGASNWALYKSDNNDKNYTKPELLPYNINSLGYEDGPYIAPDESFLIFDSQRSEGIGGSIDLYISFKKSNRWTVPMNMGPKINSASAERFARLSPDGKYLFFGSNRNMSKTNWGFDIFWIDAKVIDELRNSEPARQLIDLPLGKDLIKSLYAADTETSSKLLSQWTNSHPDNLDGAIAYSSVLRKQKRYQEADKLLSGASTKWKENTGIIMEKALVKFGMDDQVEATKILEPVLQDKEQVRERYLYISNALLDMQKLPLSDEYFDKAMIIFPSTFPYYNRACALAKIGDTDRAFQALSKAVEYGGYNVRRDYESDSSLQRLKSDARWKVLMEKLR